ncbi:protein of unknown function [Nakamurella panacisegetis]|uniref:DUF4389 domain-containing protein n=1 Tax=Nakamurella panacisegetis TaxID=1090615 RepID=A0A1H0LSQ1_9ACTN|nr:DUF4389 domain-containing protein [Nakamurella panacisegetis]SDO71218.1 protein of unknown function [Nakamurella panacisegetis]
MRPGRVVALIIGCLLVLPGVGLIFGGGALGAAYAFGRNNDGYFQVSLSDLSADGAAITAHSPVLSTDMNTPGWLIESLRTDVRLTVTGSGQRPVFIGIGPSADVDAYLRGVAQDEITSIRSSGRPGYRSTAGTAATPPTAQHFWAASANGAGTQRLAWSLTSGRWEVVVMNADGSTGVSTAAVVEIRAPFLLPLALILFVIGLVVTAGGVVLIVVGASGRPRSPVGAGELVAPEAFPVVGAATEERPVMLAATLDPGLSRWQWLVKWFLAIPHLFVLGFLWIAFVVLTVVAGFAILFTGRYPRSLFDFNLGVLRWSWRVSYYAFSGGIGTDRYPPFTLAEVPDYPARIEIAYPVQLSRGLVLVKWWLLAIPHYLILGLLASNWWSWSGAGHDRFNGYPFGGGGVLGILVFIAGCALLFTGRYPRSLFDLVVGINRWIFRVIAYAALMTDHYPPFRLDQGGSEPSPPPTLGPGDSHVPNPVNTGGQP